jgi:hypothetical protein
MIMSYLFFTLTFIINAHAAEKACNYGAKSSCPKDSYCIKYEQDKDVCRKKFQDKLITVLYPFNHSTSSFCDQGPLSTPENSHTWNNTAYAIDIKSNSKMSEEVFAGIDGTVIAFDGCKTENDQCGAGFGNQVKILTQDNFMVFYAHLKDVKVKTGDTVKAGTLIGSEGTTGWTGKDNKHLHLSVHFEWKSAGFEYWKNVGYLPSSIPFLIEDCGGKTRAIETLKCKRTSSTPHQFCSSKSPID